MAIALPLKLFREPIWLAVLLVAASLVYASFSFGLPTRYNSPDEAANAFFAQRWAAGQTLTVPSPLNQVAGEPIVHPRSTQVINGSLAPVSFLGLPFLAGSVGYVVGDWALPYVTPLGAILGLGCFYLILRELFGKRAAALATILLALLPAFWYYHSRSFFHNALFFDFLLLSAWASLKAMRYGRWSYYLTAGLAAGVALTLRTSEVFWMLAAALVWFGYQWRVVRPRYLWLTVGGACLAFLPVFSANYHIYGSIFSFGYRAGATFPLENLGATASLLKELMLPFGFHPSAIVETTQRYLVALNPWVALVAFVGVVYLGYVWRELTREQRAFALQGLVAAVWLIVLYGSWSFHDNPDPAAITLGTSYARYWLPLYATLLWPAGLLLARWWENRTGRLVSMAIIGVYAVLSLSLVVWEPQEGLLQVRANILRFAAWSQQVQRLTEPTSVIVTGSTDKIFWPQRQVVTSLTRPQDYLAIRALMDARVPVYSFQSTLPSNALAYTNTKLAGFGLRLEPVQLGFQDFSLYRFMRIANL